jgi:hypothetical protein
MKTLTTLVLAALLAAAPVAHADPIGDAERDSWSLTCQTLGKSLTGNPADDVEVFMDEVQELQNFYEMSKHDAATALGAIVRDHCDQYQKNMAAAFQYAKDQNGVQ